MIPALLAQQSEMKVVTLQEALQISDELNKDVQKAREYQNWIRGKYIEERSAVLPEFNLTAYGRRDSDSSFSDLTQGLYPATQDTAMMDLIFKQTVFSWGKIGASLRAARQAIEGGQENLRLYRQKVRRNVAQTFYDVLLAKEILEISRQRLAQRERHLEEARNKYALGTATDYEVLAAQVVTQNARPEVIRAENDVSLARRRLQYLLGQDSGDVDVSGTLEVEPAPGPEYNDALKIARQNRPELLYQQDAVKIYEELIKIDNAGDKPRIDLYGSYGRKYLSAGDFNVHGKVWSLGLTMSFPFFDGMRTRGQVLQAKSDLESAKLDEAKLEDSIMLEVRQALDGLKESGEICSALSGTIQEAEKLLFMAEKGYELGVKTRLDVDDAELNLVLAKANLARGRRDYLVSLTNVKWVQGVLGEE
jgi:HAE1 family hydrophobic/amphiphilic exporter-1